VRPEAPHNSACSMVLERVATARCVCHGFLAGTDPEHAHGIKDMPWLPAA
jgi:hypothetical protein